MTLILNEIHWQDGFSEPFQIAAADRRITFESKVQDPKRKLIPIPHLNATVSYFGLAAFTKGSEIVYLADWLPSFIAKNRDASTIEEFTHRLRDAVNAEVPIHQKKANHSGFHIAGFRSDGLPEFWHFSNIPGMTGMYYNDPVAEYGKPGPDFLGRDAKRFGWDGSDPKSIQRGGFVYRNGDIRTHVFASERLDGAMKEIMVLPGFRKTNSVEEYAEYVKFKFDIIKFVYKRWAKTEVIGDKIDVMIITRDGIRERKGDSWEYIARMH